MDKDVHLFFLVSLCLAHHRSESKQQGVGDITAPCWGMSRHFDRLYAKLHWASLIAQLVKNRQQCRRSRFGSIPESGRSAGEGIGYLLQYSWASLVAQLVKYPPAIWETWVRFLGWDDPLEKGKATHSSILACRIPWTVYSMGLQGVGHHWETCTFTFTFFMQNCTQEGQRTDPKGNWNAVIKGLASSREY